MPTSELAFGDIFRAEWLFDAYLRRDAVPLVAFTAKGGSGWKPARPSPHRDLVLAHGQQRRAILLADDCEAATIIRRGGRSRLIFAAIEDLPTGPSAADQALSTTAFRRFPLPPGSAFPGGIVEFQQLFAVGIDGVKNEGGADPRVARVDGTARIELEMRWNAYSVRRGPLVHLDTAEKFARLLTARGDTGRLKELSEGAIEPEYSAVEAARHLVQALAVAWGLEGEGLNVISEAYERGDDPSFAQDHVRDLLTELAARSQRAAAFLERLSDTHS